ncbi:MAG: L-ribulose-5-phosphate 3-epimerase [Erysipelotrichaceae bacterium]|nr:L-ribulose-5-phosphate 3-epimerase [Erysipelotrichaceae bacterium]
MNNLLGIYEKALPDLSWEERYALAADAGYDFIELSVDRNRLDKLDWTDERIEEIRNCAKDHGMTIQTMTLSANRYYPIGDPEKRDEGIRIIKKAIVLAKKLGIKLIQLTAYDVYQKTSTQETRHLYEEAIREVLSFDADYGIILAIEVLEDVDHFNTSAKLIPFIEKINDPLLKEYADTGNLIYNGFDPVKDLQDGIAHIQAIHIKDAIVHNEHNIGYGEGLVDFDEVFRYLKQVNYQGYLVSECWYEEDCHPDIRAINTFIRRKMK